MVHVICDFGCVPPHRWSDSAKARFRKGIEQYIECTKCVRERVKMNDLRKAEFARPKWLFASVKRNIGTY